MPYDTLYCERTNGRWEGWTYSDGQRVIMLAAFCKGDVIAYATRKGFRYVEVQ
jgi:hypothetical protein